MQENNNTNNASLEDVTGIKQGSNEFGSMRDIHQQYNSLSGFESMLHIIKKYRYVLYPFIFLSIAGSAYSFYNDYIVAFPMNSFLINLAMALFLSIALEIVRDASILALFNKKMKLPSRLLVSLIFLVVTSYLFSSHMKAIKIIEKNSIEYTLAHQTQEEVINLSPRLNTATQELKDLKEKLNLKRTEKTPQLMENATSIHIKKRESALTRIDKIDNQITEIEAQIKERNSIIESEKESNIKNIEDSQKIISAVLLTTLILIEALAMLGAVIKFIVTNNADKEIAKHSEIIEEYISISEVMKSTNISLTQNMAMIAQQNADNNLRTIEMMASMNNQINSKIYDFMGQLNTQSMSMNNTQKVKVDEPRRMGFVANKEAIVSKLFDGGNLSKGDKLVGKADVVNIKDRSQEKLYREVLQELKNEGIVTYAVGTGYTANSSYKNALTALK